MKRPNPFSRFMNSLTRLVTNDPVFKHRPLNAITYNSLANQGKIKQIHLVKNSDGNCTGYITVEKKQIPIVSEGSSLKFGLSPHVMFDVTQETEITHFLNTLNA